MKYEILKSYMSYCNQNSYTPTFFGLKEYKRDLVNMVELIREELYKFIELFGLSNIRTVRKSQELDRELNKKDPRQ